MAGNDSHILAIDLGTSAAKVALVTVQGRILGFEREPVPLHLLPDGGAEQDPDDWWNAIKTATHRLTSREIVPVDSITAIGVTTQWSGTVAVDSDGKHLGNAIIWLDARGAPYVQKVTGGLVKVEGYGVDKLFKWIRHTGGIPQHSGKDSIAHILFIQHTQPERYQQTYKFLEPKDYINLRLTGKFAASYDSIVLHWVTDNRDPNNIVYDDDLIRMAGIDRAKLPDLKQAVDILGPLKPGVASELGLKDGVHVAMGTPDIHSAAIGSGAIEDYASHLYIGTSSWMACHVPFKKTDILHSIASIPAAIPGQYMVVNEQETAGACLEYLRDNILFHGDELEQGGVQPDFFEAVEQITARVPAGSERLIFMPWLNGERTPVDNHLVRGGFFNMSLHHTREHMLRAVLEGVAYNSRWLFGYAERFAGRKLEPIRMIGGGANSDIWCQIYADTLDRTIHQVKDPMQANARGAALLASVAMGYTTLDQVSECVEINQTYEPNPANRAVYDELYVAYVDIYKKNHAIMEKLNKPK